MASNEYPLLIDVDAALQGSDPLDAVLASTIRHLGAATGTLHLLHEDGDLHLTAHDEGIPPPVLERIRIVPVGKGMAGLAVERAEPVQTCNLQTDDTGDVRPGARQTGLRGSIVVPVFQGEVAVGALGVGNVEEREFSDEEIALLIEVGRRIARSVAH